jgi:hypothetical protein
MSRASPAMSTPKPISASRRTAAAKKSSSSTVKMTRALMSGLPLVARRSWAMRERRASSISAGSHPAPAGSTCRPQ